MRCLGERLQREPDAQAPRVEPKKRSLGAGERDEFLRAAWRLLFAEWTDVEDLVFVDEMGTNVSLSPIYAWSRRGERAHAKAPRNWGKKNVTLCWRASRPGAWVLAWRSRDRRGGRSSNHIPGVGARASPLRPGQTVVVDNLSAHKGCRVKEILEGRGCELVYLPPYSPDLNPIEQAFSKVKGLMRKAEARTREALAEAMGRALDALTSRDARGFFGHCGYRTVDQLL